MTKCNDISWEYLSIIIIKCPQWLLDYLCISYSLWLFLVKQWHEDWLLSFNPDTKDLVETRRKKLTERSTFPITDLKRKRKKYSSFQTSLPAMLLFCVLQSLDSILSSCSIEICGVHSHCLALSFSYTQTVFQDKKLT